MNIEDVYEGLQVTVDDIIIFTVSSIDREKGTCNFTWLMSAEINAECKGYKLEALMDKIDTGVFHIVTPQ